MNDLYVPRIPWEHFFTDIFTVEETKEEFINLISQMKSDYYKMSKLRFDDKVIPEKYSSEVWALLHDVNKMIWMSLDHLPRLSTYKKSTFGDALSSYDYKIKAFYFMIHILKLEGIWTDES